MNRDHMLGAHERHLPLGLPAYGPLRFWSEARGSPPSPPRRFVGFEFADRRDVSDSVILETLVNLTSAATYAFDVDIYRFVGMLRRFRDEFCERCGIDRLAPGTTPAGPGAVLVRVYLERAFGSELLDERVMSADLFGRYLPSRWERVQPLQEKAVAISLVPAARLVVWRYEPIGDRERSTPASRRARRRALRDGQHEHALPL